MAAFRVYVCGGSAERFEIRNMLRRLQEEGIAIAHDWTVCEGYDRPSTLAERRSWAREDLEGVRMADLVWLMAPHNPSEGAFAEFGAAVILRKRVFVSGPHALRDSRVFSLMGEYFATHAEAFAAVCLARSQGPGYRD